ncbi:MAG TPA: cation:proton antiporter [Gemmatimonadaceae bacterium]|nr:cation:proton antiporter [Gemmatimonadaceae bacterium]
MRRVAVLLLLFLGMSLIIPLQEGARAAGAQSLLIFGFLVLAAYTVGELVTPLTLPRITGFLFAGMIFGPSLLGIVDAGVIAELEPVNRLAIALIAFLAGAELRWRELREHIKKIFGILTAELLLTFILLVGTLLLVRPYVPFLQDSPIVEAIALASLFSAVAIVHSPAVVLALLTETAAKGPVTRTTLSIVLVADVVVVLAFSLTLAVARAIVPSDTAAALSAGAVAWELGGSLIVGAALGGAVALYLRFVERELIMFALIIAFFGSEIARLVHVEGLLTLLVAGFVAENTTRHGAEALLKAMERSAAPVFVVFFALAGASISLEAVAAIWPLAVGLTLVRAFGIWGGSYIGARLTGASPEERSYTWMGLIAQAGVAIGLVVVIAENYPERGAEMQTLILAVIAINQVIGPILGRFALVRAGEVGKADRDEDEEVPAAAGPPASGGEPAEA